MAILNFDVHRFETEIAFKNLLDYLTMMEKSVKILQEEEFQQLSALPEPNSEEEYDERRMEMQYHQERFEIEIPNMVRYGLIMMLQSNIESNLRNTCHEIARRKQLKFDEKDYRGNVYEKAKKFLLKEANLKVAELPMWNEMQNIQKVRDSLVHVDGVIADSRDVKHLKAMIGRAIGLSLDYSDKLFIEYRYCHNSVIAAHRFFKGLLDKTGFLGTNYSPVAQEDYV